MPKPLVKKAGSASEVVVRSTQSTSVDVEIGTTRPAVRLGLTTWTFIPSITAAVGLFLLHRAGALPWWVHWVVATPLYGYILICAHDALHGSAHDNPKLNRLVGWFGTAVFAIPYPVVRRAHLSHHARTGRPDDIERFAYRPGWTMPLRWAFGNLMYYTVLPKCSAQERTLAVGTLITVSGLLILWPAATAIGWLLPMQTAVFIFMFATIYLPHGRFAAWVNEVIPVVTGFHESHHAQPFFPWHQISQWKVRAARPGLVNLARLRG
jgi:fatty acid desaturase